MKKLVIILAFAALVAQAMAVPILGTYQMVPGVDAWNYNAQLEMFLNTEGSGTTVRDLQIYGFAESDYGFGMTFFVDSSGGLVNADFTPIATVDTFNVTVDAFSPVTLSNTVTPSYTKWSAVVSGTFLDYPSTMYTINIAYDGDAYYMGGTTIPSAFLGGNAYSGTVEISSVPEPMTIALLGIGGLLLRKKK